MRPNAKTSRETLSTQRVTMEEVGTIRREDLAWLAGFIDGEGNINVGLYGNGKNHQGNYWKTFRIEVAITNTHAYAIERATEILYGVGLFFRIDLRKANSKWRPCFSITVQGQTNTVKLLKVIEPFLTCKKEIVKQALYAYEYRKDLTRARNNQHSYRFTQNEKISIIENITKNNLNMKAESFRLNLGWATLYRWKKQIETMGKEAFLAFDPINERVQDDPVLLAMIQRARELIHWRPNAYQYSRVTSTPISIKRPSETIRLTALTADDIVRSSAKAKEVGRNDQPLASYSQE